MKIVTVVGARPQFIKAAAVSRKMRLQHQEILIHTGQHYDTNMSDIFFEELDIPRPDYNLGVGSGSHAKQTSEMLVGIEKVLTEEKPDAVLVYGDTNSTFAAALAASKLLIPVIHVEAGLRSYNKQMPEEQNRILTDHVSDILFCPTDTAVENLHKEGLVNGVYQVGDVMCDAVLHYKKKLDSMSKEKFFNKLQYMYDWKKQLDNWYLATIHRVENTRDITTLLEVLSAFEELDAPVIFPVHPRIKSFIEQLQKEYHFENTCFVEPLGYYEMLYFTKNSIKVVTDSGGLQKEAYILEKNVVTIRNQTEWIETLAGNHNSLCEPKKVAILSAIKRTDIAKDFQANLYGNGHAAEKMIKILSEMG